MKNDFQKSNRREFVKTISGTFAAGMVTGGFFSSLPVQARRVRDRTDSLGIALVGLGSLSTNQIAPALQKTKQIHLAAIVTGTPEKEKIWAEKYGIGKKHIYNYENFDSIADDESVDVVYIVLPNSMHCEYTVRAAKALKHVLCEKPMANSSAECRQMIEACNQASRKLAIAYRCQFEPHHQKCIEIARKKEFGELKYIEAGFGFQMGDPNQWRLRKALAGGGALMDVGIYALQACRYLTGEEPVEIFANESKTDPVKFAEVDESIAWSMKFPGGALANCSTTYAFNGINKFHAFAANGSFGLEPAYNYSGIKGRSTKGPIEFEQVDHFAAEMDDFANCIINNQNTRVPGEEGLRDLLVIEAIYKSISSAGKVFL